MLTLFPEANRPTADENSLLEAILRLPRPRQIRASFGLYATALVAVFLTVVEISMVRQELKLLRTPSVDIPIFSTTFIAVWCAAVIYFFGKELRKLVRDRDLLSQGEVALGEIVDLRVVGGRHKRHKISYTFLDSSRLLLSGHSYDYFRELVVGDHVPIFFDAQYPSEKNIPLCGTLWEISFQPGDIPSILRRRSVWRSWFRP